MWTEFCEKTYIPPGVNLQYYINMDNDILAVFDETIVYG